MSYVQMVPFTQQIVELKTRLASVKIQIFLSHKETFKRKVVFVFDVFRSFLLYIYFYHIFLKFLFTVDQIIRVHLRLSHLGYIHLQ